MFSLLTGGKSLAILRYGKVDIVPSAECVKFSKLAQVGFEKNLQICTLGNGTDNCLVSTAISNVFPYIFIFFDFLEGMLFDNINPHNNKIREIRNLNTKKNNSNKSEHRQGRKFFSNCLAIYAFFFFNSSDDLRNLDNWQHKNVEKYTEQTKNLREFAPFCTKGP